MPVPAAASVTPVSSTTTAPSLAPRNAQDGVIVASITSFARCALSRQTISAV